MNPNLATYRAECGDLLRRHAGSYAATALANIDREYPHHEAYLQTEPAEIPRPRQLHPAFYGSFDWHSCVEMHWALVRLLRVVPDAIPAELVRAALDEHLAAEPLAAEVAHYTADANHGPNPRPYAWAWALMLAHETATCPDPAARRWAANLAGLAELCASRYLDWLPRATYPVRHGMHTNSAFGLSCALPYATARAEAGDSRLLAAITGTAQRWYGADRDYPAGWEPSGIDFLSPALVEAELMARLRGPADFAGWFTAFLPGLTGRPGEADGAPAALMAPATVSDPTDGLIAHLHGLNLSRAWCWRRVAETLPADDDRIPALLAATRRHAAAALPHVTGDDYMVEHWLVCYAVLLLS